MLQVGFVRGLIVLTLTAMSVQCFRS